MGLSEIRKDWTLRDLFEAHDILDWLDDFQAFQSQERKDK